MEKYENSSTAFEIVVGFFKYVGHYITKFVNSIIVKKAYSTKHFIISVFPQLTGFVAYLQFELVT